MPDRILLMAVLACFVLLVGGANLASATGDQVTFNETDNTVIVEVNSCDGTCFLESYTAFNLYIDGEVAESLEYGEQYRLEDSDYTNDTVEIAVTEARFWHEWDGWGYKANRSYPKEQSSANTKNGADKGNTPNRSNESAGDNTEDAPPEVVIEGDTIMEFSDCFDARHLHLIGKGVTKFEYCYSNSF